MRLDRFLTLSVFHPLVRAGLGSRGLRLPILMYHSISNTPEIRVHPYYRLNTSPDTFCGQMEFLNREGYEAIRLDQAVAFLASGSTSLKRSVVITFDDGYADFLTAGLPSLQKFGFTATVFLPTAYVGESRRSFKAKECLIWREVRDLRRQGICFGSHTVSHPTLYGLPWPEIEGELRNSKDTIEQQLQETTRFFAYPYAFPQRDRVFMKRFTDLLQAIGYECAVTTRIGRAGKPDSVFQLPRLPANSEDDPLLLGAKVGGGYDWLGVIQSVLKGWKTRRKNSVHER